MSEVPSFGRWLAQQRGAIPRMRVLWDAMEEARLAREVREGLDWKEIALRHGRSVRAVRQRALALGARGGAGNA